MTKREAAPHILAGAAALWPVALCTLEALTRTPLERALAESVCGELLSTSAGMSHCAACYGGAATLLLAAILVRFTASSAWRRA